MKCSASFTLININDGNKGDTGASAVSVSSSLGSYVFPANSSGIVSSSEYAKFSVGFVVRQGSAVFSYASTLTNGTFNLSRIESGITNTAINSSGLVVGTSSSIMANDSAKITVTVKFKDLQGKTGSYFKEIVFGKSKQGNVGAAGLTGQYTAYQYYASTSDTTQTGGSWSSTMPSIAGGRFLWMRTQVVPAGGSLSSSWGTPVLAGSDISKLMATISTVDGKTKTNASAITANANAIATKVTQTQVDNSIANISIGGRNLLLNSNNTKSGTSYNIGYFDCIRDFVVGETLTATIEGNIPGTKLFGIWFNSGSYGGYSLVKIANNKYRTTFPVPSGTTTRTIGIYLISNQSAVDSWTFYNIKLEVGNKGTDWSPAPEDIQSKIQQNTSSIEQNAKQIITKVTKTDYDNDRKEIESQISQNAEAISFGVFKKVPDANGGYRVTLSNIEVGAVGDDGYILLNAKNIIAPGSITTTEINTESLHAHKYTIANGGSIESSEFFYDNKVNDGKATNPTGFRFTDNGEAYVTDLNAQNMHAKNSTIEGNFISNALETVDSVPQIDSSNGLINKWDMGKGNKFGISKQGTEWWRGIAYGDNKFVAVGEHSQVGIYENNTWTVSKPGTSTWYGIAYGEGKFVAIGMDGRVGIYENNSWTVSTQGTLTWLGIAYGDNKFIAVGYGGQIGIYENNTWTVSKPVTTYWNGIAYGEGKFIAVGYGGKVGIYENNTWTVSKPGTKEWRGIAYGDNKFVAVGEHSQIGIYENNSWTVSTQGTLTWLGIAYGDNKFIAVGYGGQIGIYENNTWTVSTQGISHWFGIAYGDNKFVAVGGNGQIGIYGFNFDNAIFYLSTLKNQGLVKAGTTTPLALKEEPLNLLKKCSGKFKLGTTLIGNITRMQVTPSQIYIEHSAGTYIVSFDGNSDNRYSIEDLVVLPTDESVEFNLLLPRTNEKGVVLPAQIGRKGKEIEAIYGKEVWGAVWN